MSSNLKVNTILPSTGTNIGIGTAGGTVTIVGDVDIADKIVHTGDTNTSIRFPSSDTITFETNGGERFRITDAASSFQNKLIIDDGSNGHLFLNNTSSENTIHSGTTGFAAYKNLVINAAQHIFKVSNTEKVRIDSLGRLGLGTNDPSSFNSYARNLVIAQSSGDAGITISAQDAGSEYGSLHFSGGTTVRAYIDQQNGTTGRMFLMNKSNGYMGFGTNNTERVRITSSGKLLIGTTTPGYNDLDDLTISTSGNTGITIRSGTSSLGVIGFADGTSGNAQYRGVIQYSHSGDFMQFNTADAERFRITSTGELGVNTTAPVEKLGISGNMRFVNPTGTTSRITALPSGSYNTGTSGGSAICFQRFADGGGGSDEIFFETHWQGNRHGESMRINKYGHVTTPNQPSFNVTSSGGQLNSNVGTIVFTDTSSVYNHNTGNHYSTSTGRFTAPVAGKYQINARMLTNSSTNSYTIYLIRVNGTVAGYIGHNHSDYWFMESGGWVFNLGANDYVDCYLQVHSGHLGHNYASFSGFLIG